jgi:predicted Zn-dependent peptidase
MKITNTSIATLGLLLLGSALAVPTQAQLPAHPTEIQFPELSFEPPVGSEYRHELSSGVPVYVVPSHEFPLVTVSFTFKGGDYLVSDDHVGLASALGNQMRRGGTTSMSPDDLDERLDFLAANVGTSVGSETSGASIDCLKQNFDEALGLLMDVVQNPGFDEEKLRIYKDQVLEGFEQRNDNPMGVAMSNLRRIAYGDDHYSSREATKASIESISPESLHELRTRIFHPGNLLVSVTGDVEPDEILARLEKAFEGWEAGERNPDPPKPDHTLSTGLFHARTTQADLPQGTTLIVGPGIQRDDPDAVALRIMNDILGGGGFTSRVTNRVRSDEGLAYTAITQMQPQVYYPGLFFGFYQSKNRTVALAAKLVFEEIERIRTEEVTEEELRVAKEAIIEAFPQRFASKRAMLGVFVNDELTGRDPGYWSTYRERVKAVDAAVVKDVAARHLDVDEMGMLVIGNWDEIEGGDLEGRSSMKDFWDGQVKHLPMLDPMTREPMDEDEVTAP